MYCIISNELYHHGILGQKWGIRRYQNPDGTLTEAGKAKYTKTFKDAETKQFVKSRTEPWSGTHKNVQAVKKAIREEELQSSKEYKEYSKALNRLESFEETSYNNFYLNKPIDYDKWGKLQKDLDLKSTEYDKAVGEAYLRNKEVLLSAKLADLNITDNYLTNTTTYMSYLKEKFPTLDDKTLIKMIN